MKNPFEPLEKLGPSFTITFNGDRLFPQYEVLINFGEKVGTAVIRGESFEHLVENIQSGCKWIPELARQASLNPQ